MLKKRPKPICEHCGNYYNVNDGTWRPSAPGTCHDCYAMGKRPIGPLRKLVKRLAAKVRLAVQQ